MDNLSFAYSTKNIPTATLKEYQIRLTEMTDKLIRRMRWRSFFFLNPDLSPTVKETYGFKSKKPAPAIHELAYFEKCMTELIQKETNLKPHTNHFQTAIKKDIKSINDSSKLLIKADKTTNYYKLDVSKYNQLLTNNVTKDYKIAKPDTADRITATDLEIARSVELEDRIERIAEKPAFITLKDHKSNFQNNPTCRLINPTKSEIGIISKKILDRINQEVTEKTKVNNWKNSQSVIEWFRKLKNKTQRRFISFDICEFYPSITESLLSKALDHASNYTHISDKDRQIIMHAKSSLLYHKNNHWTKKNSNNTFDVTMGSYDGAETCILVGNYLLSLLSTIPSIDLGLYRDDGLAACKAPPKTVEIIKKKICSIFKNLNLKITIEANQSTVDFLDVTFNLETDSYRPYTKPNNNIQYVHRLSNHPPSIIKNIPENINRRLTTLSSSKREFDLAAPPYQKALQQSGYDYKLEYKPTTQKPTNKQKRTRNITWYNPPYNSNVQNNLGKQFLVIINKCFPPTNPLSKIFNKNTLKLSYSCMPNLKQKVTAHNNKILNSEITTNTHTCNCRRRDQCPLDGKCLQRSITYQATVCNKTNNTEETYVGMCETDFKARFRNHKASFTHTDKRHQTELSKHIWQLKDNNIDFDIKWKIVKPCQSYSNKTKKCNLCIFEKYLIICKPKMCTLNKRNELAATCRHSKNYLLTKPKR